ncbi:hypothetical protein [Nonomuraea sp. NEAU-A123]|uniref:hypothetical protein n=1 Tax=Nonomuraea sp. NEAU-A123 TaxID=2839649 RepID=UPI001BE484C0|nr:hypothetical protein [Nonomuraea sp. NEAU-A123]MBT2225990.1 hypothetical protein [Nonomuraea sp. NEAU-A123]
MTNAHPYPDPDLQEVITRNRTARQLITTFARSTTTLADLWQHVTAALADTPTLVVEITRLRSEITRLRLDRADLMAAARATLHAHADGEHDPLYYLRDELSAQRARARHPRGKRGGRDAAS